MLGQYKQCKIHPLGTRAYYTQQKKRYMNEQTIEIIQTEM